MVFVITSCGSSLVCHLLRLQGIVCFEFAINICIFCFRTKNTLFLSLLLTDFD